MDPRRLEHFLAVAETMSFTRAAKILHIAQPSLSQSIKTLERELKVTLFHRLTTGLELTSAGQALLSPASRALRALKDADETMRELVEVRSGSLDVVAPSSLITYPTAELIGRFRTGFPKVKLVLGEATDSQDAAERVRDGRAEVAVFETTQNVAGLIWHRIVSHELYAVFPPGVNIPPQVPESIPWRALADYELIGLAPYTVSRKMIDKHGLSGNVAVEVHSIEAALELVRLGVGASVLIEPYAFMAREAGAQIAQLEPRHVHNVGLGCRQGEVAPAVRAFINTAMHPDGGSHPPAGS